MSRLTPVTSSAGRGASRRNWWSAQMPSASPLKISYDFAMLSDSERRLVLRSPRPMRLASSLAVAYLLVIAYASLQPFTGWWMPPEEIRQFLTRTLAALHHRRRRHGEHRRVRAAGISAGALVHAPRAAPARGRARRSLSSCLVSRRRWKARRCSCRRASRRTSTCSRTRSAASSARSRRRCSRRRA